MSGPAIDPEAEIEERFIAAVLKDGTGDNFADCRVLPPEIFETPICYRAWKAIRGAATYEEAATQLDTVRFFAHPTTGADYIVDRDRMFIRWLSRRGLSGAQEWFASLPHERKAHAWRPVDAHAFCAEPPATPPELIKGLLYRSGTLMLSGASKSHKTYTMIAASIAVAGGHYWLGLQTTPTPVLYLNLELQDFATAARVTAICAALQVEAPANLHLVNLRGTLVTVDAFEARIGRLIDETGAGLVVIDPHYKLASASGTEENSNDAQANLLYRIESAVCSKGAAVMIAHHFAKGDSSAKKSIDRAAGGGALARWPDVVMTLTEHQEEDCVTAEFALRNFAPVRPFVLRWRHPIWTVENGADPALLKKAGRSNDHPASELLTHLRDGMSYSEWRDAAGWTDSTFRRKREELVRARRVRTQSGCYFHVEAAQAA